MFTKAEWHPRGSLFERPIINVSDDISKMDERRRKTEGRRILDGGRA